MSSNDVENQTSKSTCQYFNELFRFESREAMFERNEKYFLKLNELMNWGYNESDIPERPNKIFLEDNQIHLLMPYLNGKDKKNGRQRTFDNVFYALSPDSYVNNKKKGLVVNVLGRLNNRSSVLMRHRPGLRWVKFGLYKYGDVDGDVNYLNSIKQNAGAELMVFLYYYQDIFSNIIRYFGTLPINGYDYIFGDNKVPSSRVAYIYSEMDKDDRGHLKPMISFRNREQSRDEGCLFLVDDYS